jgi:hypothetical protein
MSLIHGQSIGGRTCRKCGTYLSSMLYLVSNMNQFQSLELSKIADQAPGKCRYDHTIDLWFFINQCAQNFGMK